MSTFGKKALLNWDYNSVDKKRFSKSNKIIQLEILKKWYPIGETFYTKDFNKEFEVTGHNELLTLFILQGNIKADLPISGKIIIKTTTHPLNLKEPKWVERDRNIENLLK